MPKGGGAVHCLLALSLLVLVNADRSRPTISPTIANVEFALLAVPAELEVAC